MSSGRDHQPAQLQLGLGTAPRRGSFECATRLAGLGAAAIAKSGKSREMIALEMTELLGIRVTEMQINAWTAPAKPLHRFPAEYLGAFCRATGDRTLVELVAGQAGVHVVQAADAARLRVWALEEKIRALRAQKAELRAELEGHPTGGGRR